MTMLSIKRKSSKRHRRKVISSLHRFIPSKNTTRYLGSIKHNLMTTRINRLSVIRNIHHRTTKRKKTHHQSTVLNTLNPQNHRVTRTKKKMKRRRRKKAVSKRNARKPIIAFTRWNLNGPSIIRKILRRNSKNLTEKSYRKKVRRTDESCTCKQNHTFITVLPKIFQ